MNPKPLWDDEGPFFPRLWNTWVNVMFHPAKFFCEMPVNKGIGRPLLYAVIVGSFGAICALLWQFIFSLINISFMQSNLETFLQQADIQNNFDFAAFKSLFTAVSLVVWMLLAPVFVVIGQFIWAGVMHVSIMILGDNKKGFEATFRAIAYANTSPGVFAIIPFCGGFIAFIWSMILVIIGLKEAHQIPFWKVILAYFLPLLLCCLCGIILIVIFGAAMLAMMKAA